MPTSSALLPTTLLKKFLPLFLVAGALALVPRANASFQLSFVYDPITGATTATYYGSWATFEDSVFSKQGETLGLTRRSFFRRDGGSWDYATRGIRGENVITTEGEDGHIINDLSYMYYPWDISGYRKPDYISGDSFGFDGLYRYAPVGYVASTLLSGYMIFEGKDLASLGFSPENINASGILPAFSGNAGNDVYWSTSDGSVVPEPASFGLLIGTTALGFGLWRIRRRRSQIA